MKICAIICEYNPLHNGHAYHIRQAKRLSDSDFVLCLMSGNFVQRGESAILDKHTRAKHAVLAGADVVVELPTLFATSNAELFAKGAVAILSAIPDVTTLCFGAETEDKARFLQAARLLNDEPKEVSEKIKALTGEGMSFAKARALAWQGRLDGELLSSPNNILGLEYTRAILEKGADIDILPLLRQGSGYKTECLEYGFASATALRAAVKKGEDILGFAPDFVAQDLESVNGGLPYAEVLDRLEKYAILQKLREEIARVCDCTEGLENALKKAATKEETLAESLTSARYTTSRIRRIALQNLLGIEEETVRAGLRSPLYLRVLAVREGAEALLSGLAKSDLPLLLRGRDEEKLQGVAKVCGKIDAFAEEIYPLIGKKCGNDKNIFVKM